MLIQPAILLALLPTYGNDVGPVVDRATAVSFRLDVVPVFAKLGCSQGACHGSQKGKGGFKLSLRGDDPAADALAIARDSFGRRVNRFEAEKSLLVQKPSGQVPHEGGKLFEPNSVTAKTLARWISQRCRDDRPDEARVQTLRVEPSEKLLSSGSRRQQLRVLAELTNGATRDVTPLAVYEASEPGRVSVSADGLVKASEPLEVAVAVRYAGCRTVSRLAFLAERTSFVWKPVEPLVPFDHPVLAKLQSVQVQPSETADDTSYLRRAYLAAIGRLPTVVESKRFLFDGDQRKRDKLAASLVDRPEFAEFWALKWADVLRNEEKVMGKKGVEVFGAWLVDQIKQDQPVTAMVRSLLTATGSTWKNPPASFHRTNREPAIAAEAAAQVFLGYRLQCAKCHNHPFDVWTQDDYYGLAAYFAGIERKQTDGDKRKDKNDKHEISGDEVISVKPNAEFRHPIRNVAWSPKPLGFPVNDARRNRTEPLTALADGIVADPQFARNLSNRVWYHLFGKGIVDPPDDFRESNPPSNPALLEALTGEFAKGGLRLKRLVATILRSRTFQSSSIANESNADDEINFARYPAHLLPAEVLYDAIAQVLEIESSIPGEPKGKRAVQLTGAKDGGRFMKVFGKPDRLLTCECERFSSTSLAQAFQMINGPDVRRMLAAKENRIGRLLASGSSNEAIVEEFYLAALCRIPSAVEKSSLATYIGRSKERRTAIEDVVWGLINAKEFLLQH